MKRKDFFKSLAALPFVAKAMADPLKPEELAAEEAKEKAKAGIREGNFFENPNRGDFKMFREDIKHIPCSTDAGYYDFNPLDFATGSWTIADEMDRKIYEDFRKMAKEQRNKLYKEEKKRRRQGY